MRYKAAVAVLFSILLGSCSSGPSTVTGNINHFVQTASGAVQQAKNTAQDLQKRAQNVQKGLKQLESGAGLIQNSIKP